MNRLFVTVDGEFFPCERVSESNEIFKIGNLDDGFNIEKVKINEYCKVDRKTM